MRNRTEHRKEEHIRISLNRNVQAKTIRTGFENVSFVHRALPEMDRQKIDLSTKVFDYTFAAPLIVGAITGGTQKATEINSRIAEVVQELKLGMGVGSQRAAIENKKLEKTFTVVRKKAPDAFLVANIGGIQLVNGYGIREIRRAMRMIDADALAVHLNALQEAAQPEGQTNFKGVLEKIRGLAQDLEEPVIVKETGAGISSEQAQKLEAAGVKAIDVSGAGGTSFAAVEFYRTKNTRHGYQRRIGEAFWDWGIPTVASIVEVARTVKIPVIASGGIRNGLDIAKGLALGARLASLSQPVLRAAMRSSEEVKNVLSFLIEELKNTAFLVGADSALGFQKVPVIIIAETAEWLVTRGLNIEDYARRGRD